MTDALTTGAERLATLLSKPHGEEIIEIDEEGNVIKPWLTDVSAVIAADPGVRALVALAHEVVNFEGGKFVPVARAALKLWEHGDE